jgi:hypothetical protein
MTDPALPHRSAEDVPPDDGPSIAELQRLTRVPVAEELAIDGPQCVECQESFSILRGRDPGSVCDPCAQYVVAEVLPVLLEIAAAALLEHGPCDHPEGRCGNGSHFRGCPRFEGQQRMHAALAKVRR